MCLVGADARRLAARAVTDQQASAEDPGPASSSPARQLLGGRGVEPHHPSGQWGSGYNVSGPPSSILHQALRRGPSSPAWMTTSVPALVSCLPSSPPLPLLPGNPADLFKSQVGSLSSPLKTCHGSPVPWHQVQTPDLSCTPYMGVQSLLSCSVSSTLFFCTMNPLGGWAGSRPW